MATPFEEFDLLNDVPETNNGETNQHQEQQEQQQQEQEQEKPQELKRQTSQHSEGDLKVDTKVQNTEVSALQSPSTAHTEVVVEKRVISDPAVIGTELRSLHSKIDDILKKQISHSSVSTTRKYESYIHYSPAIEVKSSAYVETAVKSPVSILRTDSPLRREVKAVTFAEKDSYRTISNTSATSSYLSQTVLPVRTNNFTSTSTILTSSLPSKTVETNTLNRSEYKFVHTKPAVQTIEVPQIQTIKTIEIPRREERVYTSPVRTSTSTILTSSLPAKTVETNTLYRSEYKFVHTKPAVQTIEVPQIQTIEIPRITKPVVQTIEVPRIQTIKTIEIPRREERVYTRSLSQSIIIPRTEYKYVHQEPVYYRPAPTVTYVPQTVRNVEYIPTYSVSTLPTSYSLASSILPRTPRYEPSRHSISYEPLKHSVTDLHSVGCKHSSVHVNKCAYCQKPERESWMADYADSKKSKQKN